MSGVGRLQLVDVMPVDVAMQVERLAFTRDAIEADTLARFGDQVIVADAPSPLVHASLRTAADVGCARWVGVEHEGTLATAALVIEVGYDEACRRVWTAADGLIYTV